METVIDFIADFILNNKEMIIVYILIGAGASFLLKSVRKVAGFLSSLAVIIIILSMMGVSSETIKNAPGDLINYIKNNLPLLYK